MHQNKTGNRARDATTILHYPRIYRVFRYTLKCFCYLKLVVADFNIHRSKGDL